jgi:hypothetical protein
MSWNEGERRAGTYGKRPRTGRDVPGNAETEEVEKGDAQCDDDARPQHGGIVNHLMPTAGEVEEGRTRSPCDQDGYKDDNGSCSKKAFETDSIEGSNRVLCHDLFFDDELGCGANCEGDEG